MSDFTSEGAAPFLGFFGRRVGSVSASFTRPNDTTAYASGDLVANSTTAGQVVPMSLAAGKLSGGSGTIKRAQLSKSGTTPTNAQFRVHFYSASPTPANGDNGAWSTSGAANYLGSMTLAAAMARVFSDGCADTLVPDAGSEINFTGQTVYALIEARAAYTPGASEVFTLTLEVWQN
jgi:hypothetical protein